MVLFVKLVPECSYEFRCTVQLETLVPDLLTYAVSHNAGCCMVLKPSELASLTCLEFGAICDAAHVPAGVVQIVTGLGAAVGAPLAAHPRIQKISFTGSNATGRLVAAAAARNLTPCSLELGGKSALIVFEDTDLDKAVEWAMFGCFWTNGQICSSTSRLLVQESVAASFYEKLKQRAECIRISDPMQEDCRMGPLVSSGQYSKVVAMVEVCVLQVLPCTCRCMTAGTCKVS